MLREHLVHLERIEDRQTLRIPQEFELATDDAVIRKEGERLIIDPVHKPSLLELLATLEPIEETFLDVDNDLPPLDDILL